MSTTPNLSPAPAPAPARRYRPRSFFGPLVLIIIGLLFLARNLGWIPGHTLFWWFGRYWPALLILWGLVRVLEYFWARRSGEPIPSGIGAGGIVFLIFFIVFGMSMTGLSRVDWDNVNPVINVDDTDWTVFSNRYEFSDNVSQATADATQARVLAVRGDVNITASPDNQAHLYLHKSLSADSQDAGNHLNDSTHPKFVQQGKVLVLDLTSGDFERGRFRLDLQLPPNLALSVSTQRGDVAVTQRVGDVELATERGDVSAKDVKGNVTLRLHHGDVTVDGATGNVQVDGSGGDVTVSNVTGTLTVNGEYQGDSHYNHIGGEVRFKSERTDLQLAKLDGDFNMDTGDLRADSISGPLKLNTRSKSLHLENVTGDVHIDDANAEVELVTKAPLGAIDISSTRGGIELTVPSSAGFQVDAESRGGEINSDFSLNIDNQHRDATAHGIVGKGGPLVRLRAERGTIQIHKN